MNFTEAAPLVDVHRSIGASRMPMVIETNDCCETGGSNVLLFDGHVEWIAHVDWDRVMGPYLAYRH